MRNDADVVSAPTDGRTLSYRNIVYGTILVLVGLGALIVGVSTQLIVVGVIGFVVMLGGVILAVTPDPRHPARSFRSAARSTQGSSELFLHGSHERPVGSTPRRAVTRLPPSLHH